MLKILTGIGCILLFLLILLLWVILIPRSVYIEYADGSGLSVKMRVFFFKIKVYPFSLPFKRKKEEKEKDKDKKPQKAKKKSGGLSRFTEDLPRGFELIKEIFRTAKGTAAILFKGITVKDVSFTLPVQGKDAHSVQKNYAAVTSAFYSLSIFLQKYIKIFYKNPVFVADFADNYSKSKYFYCKITASPSIILAAAWYLFKAYCRLTDKKPLKEK